MIESLVLVLHVLVGVAVIALILLQQGKGADAGASFGSGSSQTVFGASGGAGVLVKVTAWLAALFFATSLGLAYYARLHADTVGQVDIVAPVIDAAIIDAATENAVEPVAESDIPQAPAAAENDAADDVPSVN